MRSLRESASRVCTYARMGGTLPRIYTSIHGIYMLPGIIRWGVIRRVRHVPGEQIDNMVHVTRTTVSVAFRISPFLSRAAIYSQRFYFFPAHTPQYVRNVAINLAVDKNRRSNLSLCSGRNCCLIWCNGLNHACQVMCRCFEIISIKMSYS